MVIILLPENAIGQGMVTVSGKIIDKTTNEALAFANIAVDSGRAGGASTDENGMFSFRLKRGAYQFNITYLGYKTMIMDVNLLKNTTLSIALEAEAADLEEVIIKGEKFYGGEKVSSTEMSTIELGRREIQMIPNIAGEQDIVKVVQLLPGVSKGVEGTGDYFVRGGDADQNLLVLDGATIYNTGHLFGFVSVFNPDIIKDAKFVKGAFPAEYGGRLSSILDVNTRDDVPDGTEVEGSVGIISSRLTLREPVMQKKMVAMVSARRTYIDQVLKTIKTDVQLPYYFYDFNGKLDYQLNKKNKLFLSVYLGADILDYNNSKRDNDRDFTSNFTINNNSQSIGWNSLYSDKTTATLLISRTLYSYDIYNSFVDNQIKTSSGIEDYAMQYDVKNYFSNTFKVTVGVAAQTHSIDPIIINSDGIIENIVPSSKSNHLDFSEGAVYVNTEKDLTDKWKLDLGYRQSFAQSQQSFYTSHEPRLAARYKLTERSSFKTGYSRMTQYMHRVSSSAITLPVDLWYGVTDEIKPQTANQWVLGFVNTFPKPNILVESEIYYKDMYNITEYKEGTNLILNTDFENALLQGKGNSYGLETTVKKEMKKWHATVGYTLNWANREFKQLNNGKSFPAKYDRRHNASVICVYDITKRLSVSAVWEFISGSRFTPIIGQYAILNPNSSGVDVLNIYTDRNEVRLSDSHRLDMMLIWKSKQDKKFKSEWHLGVYNVYNRATPIAINIIPSETGGYRYEQPGLFGTIPTISYHFKF